MACSRVAATGTADVSYGSSDSELDDNQVIKSEVRMKYAHGFID